jgi:tripartite-type tricarboxylate transporter receptor subunit TctC
MKRVSAVRSVVAVLLAACAFALGAQTFPSKPVRIVVPYPAGGSTDVLARALANELTQVWRQPVVVENIGGAGSIIGTERVAVSAPDGHTLLFTIDPTVVANRFLYNKLPYDPDKSLTPISMIARSGQFIIVHPSFPANTLRELVEVVRRSPGKIAYSSYGLGAHPHLVLETIAKREGLKFLHVPYKGIAPSTAAVVAGEVQLSIGSPAATQSRGHRRHGQSRPAARNHAHRPDPHEPLSRRPDLGRGRLPVCEGDHLVRPLRPRRRRRETHRPDSPRRHHDCEAPRLH